ncbi:PD-(D/E)XK nuclease family protein [Halobaculum rubrum]|uniref:PD-(D/E)XK nuclease family protein n=1 Tax=Halobaculum rubrum TaxID=2872158 RepID=UPI001CA40D77|nr:PD-(D/E)XK nuclease family protein [Halobaculum rubrum]QZX99237.1 PD-(D/E)XK nuclease family protein [Halobaculum rubrum]
MTRQVHADVCRSAAEQTALERAAAEAPQLPGSVVYLAPPSGDPARIRQTWREIASPIRLRVRTFDGLVTDALERATFRTRNSALTAEARLRLVENAVDGLDDAHPLVSARTTASAQTYSQAENLLSLLEFADITGADAVRDDDRLASIDVRTRDALAELYAAFTAARDDHAAETGTRPSIRSEQYRTVIDHPEALTAELDPATTVVFGGHTVFSALERDLVAAIADGVDHARAILPLAGDPNADRLAGVDRAVERASVAYEDAGFEFGRSPTTKPSELLVERLYRFDDRTPLPTTVVEAAGLDCRHYPTADHELRGAFRQVADWVEAGTSSSEIAVVVPDLASCTEQVAEAAAQYGLAPHISREVGLANTELGEVLVNAFRLDDDATVRDLIRLVDSPLVDPDWPDEPVDAATVLTAGSALEATDLDTLTAHLGTAEPGMADAIAWLRSRCARLADCTPTTAADRLEELLIDLGVLDADAGTDWTLVTDHETGWIAARERAAVRGVRDIVDSFEGIRFPADVPFGERLQTAVDAETVDVDAGTTDDVRVCTPSAAAHLRLETVFVLGLTDDRTPSNPTRLAFARSVNDAHPDFAESDAVQQTRHAIGSQLANADTVVLSRPLYTTDGDETVPADILTELERVTAEEAIPTEQVRDSDVAPRSREDIQRRLASVLDDHSIAHDGVVTAAETEAVAAVAEADAFANAAADPTERLRAGVACAAGRRSPRTTRYDGHLSPETVAQFAAASTPLSPSRVDRYVTCGFKFYARTVLGFEEPDSEPLELDALDSGRLVHNVFARFIGSLQSNLGEPVTVETSQKYHTAMYEAAVTEIERPYVQAHDTAFHDGWLQRLFAGLDPARPNEYDGPDGYEGLLVRALRSLAEETDRFTARPAYVEADVGVEADGPIDGPTAATGRDDDPVTLLASEAVDLVPDAPFRFRGKVDRVDIVPDATPTQITAIDYKTGSHPSVSDVRNGVSFQLPLYLRLLETALDDVETVGAAYYDLDIPTGAGVSKSPFTSRLYTSYGGGTPLQRQRTTGLFDYHRDPDSEPAEGLDMSGSESEADLDPDDRFDDFLHGTLDDRLTTITTAMTEGVYHPTLLGAEAAKCDYCAYADVCDVRHHQRVDRVDDHGLETAYVPDAARPTGGAR